MRWALTAVLGLGCAAAAAQDPSTPQDTVAAEAEPQLPDLRSALLDDAPARAEAEIHLMRAHRALFCRFDDALDRERIPLRMRLGTLEEVNRKEGKPGW